MRITRSSQSAGQSRRPSPSLVRRILKLLAVVAAGLILLLVVVVLLNPAGLQKGIAALEARFGPALYSFDQPLAEQLSVDIGDFLRTTGDASLDIPKLVIDIPFKGMQKILEKRDAALQGGKLVQGEDDFVKAEIRSDERTVPIKLRLKGDWNDHLMGRKWSFRIHVRNGDQLFGMRRFSVQNPLTRDYQAEILFFETVKKLGVMTPRYFFVDVTLNGESMGVMALEESFSKELLEFNRRREGVIVRFDESMVWDATDSAWGETVGWEGAFDHYRNAAVDGFGSGRIAESPVLTKQYRVAAGLLRGFVAGDLSASEVFDAEQLGRLMAAADLYGTWHATAWHNMRFYLNPVTLKLEPIAYDATLQRRLRGDQSILNDDPFMQQVIKDPVVFDVYQRTLHELAELVSSGELVADMRAAEVAPLKVLRTEFRALTEFPLDYLQPRIEALLSRYGTGEQVPAKELFQFAAVEQNIYPILARVRMLDAANGKRIEITNVIPKAVEVLALEWINDEAKSRLRFNSPLLPFLMPARGIGDLPQHWFFDVGQAPAEGIWHLEAVVRYRDRPWVRRVRAYESFESLKVAPIPVGDVTRQLDAHAFLSQTGATTELRIGSGLHKVVSDLVIPAGYSLVIEAGARLQFAENAVLISHGPLQIAGSAAAPVVFEGIAEAHWPGLVVLNAGAESVVQHWTVRNTSSIVLPDWTLTGGVNFYASDVQVLNCQFVDSHGEDALNIIQSEFEIRDSVIIGTASDAFDSDFSTGLVADSRFEAVGKAGGGDAIDVSGTRITVSNTEFSNVSDKALSVGEKSEMSASGITMNSVGTGAAAKDGSFLRLEATSIDAAAFAGLTAYIKKPEYGPASIEAINVQIANTETPALAQTGSAVSIDGEAIATTDVNVDELYETIMRKGLR